MVDVRGEQISKFDPVYYMYFKARRMQLGIVSHFTNQGITLLTRHWETNLRGLTINSRIITLTDDMINNYMQKEIDFIKEEYNIT